MSQNPPERIRKVAYGEEVPPTAFGIEPVIEEGVIVGFTIQDPEVTIIRRRGAIADLIHEQFPGVSREEVENAQIGYGDYSAHIRLPQR